MQSLKEYLKQRDLAQSEYEKFKQRLELKKEKLFQTGDMSRWELSGSQMQNINKQDLPKNKPLSFQYMLPKVRLRQMKSFR
jgi:hypothetical protein